MKHDIIVLHKEATQSTICSRCGETNPTMEDECPGAYANRDTSLRAISLNSAEVVQSFTYDVWERTNGLRWNGYLFGKPVLEQLWVSQSGKKEWRPIPQKGEEGL